MVVDEKLDESWQCVLTAKKTKHILGCIKRNMASNLRDVVLPIYTAL